MQNIVSTQFFTLCLSLLFLYGTPCQPKQPRHLPAIIPEKEIVIVIASYKNSAYL